MNESQRDLAAFARAKHSGVMVEFQARVVKLHPDDHDGARHQRFILAIDYRPATIRSVLVAHNIDLCERVPVQVGSVIRIRGQYEWTELGGTIHWTHRDPEGLHHPGWIDFEGHRYE